MYQNILVPTISYYIAGTNNLSDSIIIPVYDDDHRIKLRRTLNEEPYKTSQSVIIYVRHDRWDREVMCISINNNTPHYLILWRQLDGMGWANLHNLFNVLVSTYP